MAVSKYAPIDNIVAFLFGGMFFVVGSLLLWVGVQVSQMLVSIAWIAISLAVSFVALQIMWKAAENYEEIELEEAADGDTTE